MATSKIVNDIEAVVGMIGGSPAPDFLYAGEAEANMADDMTFPAVILDVITDIPVKNTQGGAKILTYKIKLFFCDKADELQDTEVNNDIIVSAQVTMATSFIAKFENEYGGEYYWIKDVEYRVKRNVFDGILTGVLCMFSVTSKTVLSTC